MILLANFIFNLFCAFIECPTNHPNPTDPLYQNRVGKQIGLRNSKLIHFNNTIERDEYPVVRTLLGDVQGYTMKTIKQRPIYAFEGIPYAETTEGINRFKPPIPKHPWKGVRKALSPGHICLQIHQFRLFQILGREDCLSVQIYTPYLPSETSQLLPVIFWIHGGAYVFGSGSEYGPAYFLDRDVIFVTINYRLGVLGFLSTGDEVSPGNNGLKDQRLAMQFVQDNIEFFGGDKNRVTIMGQSAGAASVHLHMMSEEEPLFASGVSMSASAFSNWAIVPPNVNLINNRKLSNQTNCPLTTSHIFVECLRKMNAFLLVGKQQFMYDWLVLPPVLFGPVVEEKREGAFLTQNPFDAYKEKKVAKLPWISTRTAHEGYLLLTALYAFGILRTLTNHWDKRASVYLDYQHTVHNPDEVTKKIQKYYFGDVIPKNANQSIFGDIYSDRVFYFPLTQALNFHSSIAPTYSYIFNKRAANGVFRFLNLRKSDDVAYNAIVHSDDIFIMMNGSQYGPGWKTTDPDYAFVKLLTNLFANFADKGEPLYTNEDGSDVQIWNPVNTNDIEYLDINDEIKMIKEPYKERLEFWNDLKLEDMPIYESN